MAQPLLDASLGLVASGLACGAWAYAAMWPASQIFGRTLIAGSNPEEAALTYDDGPNGDTTLRLLDVLGQHNARATFFVLGGFTRQQPGIVRAIADGGHLVGNHTMTHPWLHVQSSARIRQELSDCNAVLEDTLGAPVGFFRAPHGARRPVVLRIARELGLTPVQWNVMALDWNPYPAATLVERIERGVDKNRRLGRSSNILLHDGGFLGLGQPRMPTVEATDQVLSRLAVRNIRPVTVDAWV
jgi:peptidoglycan/xylan/chitin deacetylase (PgdA/CDA1 family)